MSQRLDLRLLVAVAFWSFGLASVDGVAVTEQKDSMPEKAYYANRRLVLYEPVELGGVSPLELSVRGKVRADLKDRKFRNSLTAYLKWAAKLPRLVEGTEYLGDAIRIASASGNIELIQLVFPFLSPKQGEELSGISSVTTALSHSTHPAAVPPLIRVLREVEAKVVESWRREPADLGSQSDLQRTYLHVWMSLAFLGGAKADAALDSSFSRLKNKVTKGNALAESLLKELPAWRRLSGEQARRLGYALPSSVPKAKHPPSKYEQRKGQEGPSNSQAKDRP